MHSHCGGSSFLLSAAWLVKSRHQKNQTEVKALVINAEKVDESKLKDLIESAGKINQSVYTDETVNTLNQAKEEAEGTIQGKPNQEEVEDSYLNLVNAIQSLQEKNNDI